LDRVKTEVLGCNDETMAQKLAWHNDDEALEVYFLACHENYKNYLGEKTESQRLKLYAVYKQATVGDCHEDMPYDSAKRKKWEMWTLFKGMEKKPAMRRYITLLRQLDPRLVVIEVKCEER
jgi:diazepam-binding inhibitor (GABA receptor modulator, acyl-CoA-binding protein)